MVFEFLEEICIIVFNIFILEREKDYSFFRLSSFRF